MVKSSSRDRLSLEDPTPDSAMASQEPADPLVLEKYMHRLHTEVREVSVTPSHPHPSPLVPLLSPDRGRDRQRASCEPGRSHK